MTMSDNVFILDPAEDREMAQLIFEICLSPFGRAVVGSVGTVVARGEEMESLGPRTREILAEMVNKPHTANFHVLVGCQVWMSAITTWLTSGKEADESAADCLKRIYEEFQNQNEEAT